MYAPCDDRGTATAYLYQHLVQFRWIHLGAGLSFAPLFGYIAQQLFDFPQRYPFAFAGELTLAGGSKFGEFALAYGLVVGCVFGFLFSTYLGQVLVKRKGKNVLLLYERLISYCCLPTLFWLALVSGAVDWHLGELGLALFCFLSVYFYTGLVLFLPIPARSTFLFMKTGLLVTLLSPLAYLSFITVAMRVMPNDFSSLFLGISSLVVFTLCISGAFLLFCWQKKFNLQLKQQRLWIGWIQYPIVGSLFLLIPTPWKVSASVWEHGYAYNTDLIVLIACLGGLFTLGILRRTTGNLCGKRTLSFVSPICLFAFLAFWKLARTAPPFFSIDEYHVGDFFLAFDAWAKHGLLPFTDYIGSRGIIIGIPGWISATFFDGTIGAHNPAMNLYALVLLLIYTSIVCRLFGFIPTAITGLFLPLTSPHFWLSQLHIILTICFCLFVWAIRYRKQHWLIGWLPGCLILILLMPGQGTIFFLATLIPLIVCVSKAQLKLRYLAGGAWLTGCLLFFDPLSDIGEGALLYLRENLPTYAISQGILWNESLAHSKGLIFEILRNSYLIDLVAVSLALLTGLFSKSIPRKEWLPFGIVIVVALTLLVPRATTRIDPGWLSRNGLISIWAGILTILFFSRILLRRYHWPLYAGALALISPLLPGTIKYSITEAMAFHMNGTRAPENLETGKSFGFPSLGKVAISPKQIEKLSLLKKLVDEHVPTGQTFLDLTNRLALYSYFEKPPPLEFPSYHCLSHPDKERRALRRLRSHPVPLVIGENDSRLNRTRLPIMGFFIYKHLLANYLPQQRDGIVYLIPKNRKGFAYTELQLKLLDQIFLVSDLNFLPREWGREIPTSQNRHGFTPPTFRKSKEGGKDFWVAQIDLRGKISPKDYGLLLLKMGTKRSVSVEIHWSPRSGKLKFTSDESDLMVPLDVAPRWLSNEQIEYLQWRIAVEEHPTKPQITKLAFAKRLPLEHENDKVMAKTTFPAQ